MAGDERVGERVYRQIKNAILTGELRLRQRLDIDELAQRFRASATPVRQALAILTGQRLVSMQEARGYYVSFWSERELRDLYEWRWRLAALAAVAYKPVPIGLAAAQRRAHVDGYSVLMAHLAASANPEVRIAADLADERLHAALRAEPDALADAEAELVELERALGASGRALQLALKRYFKRRIVNCSAIRAKAHAHALPRNSG